MITLRANDGSSPPQFKVAGPPVPGERQATPSCPIVNGVASGVAFQWQNITPFGIPSAKSFLLDPPPALTSNRYAKAYNEVMTVGSIDSTERPQDRADVVLFYAASSPTQVFNQAAPQVAQERSNSLSENTRAFALINMAVTAWSRHSSTSITPISGDRRQRSMVAIRMAIRKLLLTPTMLHSW